MLLRQGGYDPSLKESTGRALRPLVIVESRVVLKAHLDTCLLLSHIQKTSPWKALELDTYKGVCCWDNTSLIVSRGSCDVL
jgi:hypothetical protein